MGLLSCKGKLRDRQDALGGGLHGAGVGTSDFNSWNSWLFIKDGAIGGDKGVGCSCI